MSDTIPSTALVAMLKAAGARIHENVELLTKLDTATGDGDHGTAMQRSIKAIEKALEDHADAGPGDAIGKAGWAVMSAAGGSTGPLLGSFLMGLSAAVPGDDTLDAPALSAVIRAAIAQMHKHSKAQVGDKTMMDALLPAADALEANEATATPAAMLQLAAEAAAKGAEATKDMTAKFGRARNLGDRVLGHADPGATSMSLILAGFADALG